MDPNATVRVTFVDSTDGSVLGVVDLSASRIPATFELETRLHLGYDEWEVVSADPPDAAAFVARGTLRLAVRPAPVSAGTVIQPRTSFFRYPSLADPLPTGGAPLPEGKSLELEQDEWRQIEFVALAHAPTVTAELAAIERIVREARAGGGYCEVHSRRALPEPLHGASLPLDALRGAFRGAIEPLAGILVQGGAGAVDGGFAFRTAAGLTVYGVERGGLARVLAMRPNRERPGPPVDAPALAALRRAHGLLVVDWTARTAVSPPRDARPS